MNKYELDKEIHLKMCRNVMIENIFSVVSFVILAIVFKKWWLSLFSLIFQQRVIWRKNKWNSK